MVAAVIFPMLSGVLNSERAILANIQIMRNFGHLRRLIGSHRVLAAFFLKDFFGFGYIVPDLIL